MAIPRQASPYVSGSLVPLSMGMPTPSPAMVPVMLSKSNLERLWEVRHVSTPEPLKKDEFPNTRFWERDLWQDWVKIGKERGSFNAGVRGKGVNSSFLEDRDGNRVPLKRQKQVLNEVSLEWRTMKDAGVDLKPYSEMSARPLEYFRAMMESSFFELRLCADHWKADEIWQQNFSSWSNKSRKISRTKNPQEDTGVPCQVDPDSSRREDTGVPRQENADAPRQEDTDVQPQSRPPSKEVHGFEHSHKHAC